MEREAKTLQVADEKEFELLSWKCGKNLTHQRSAWLMTIVIVFVVGAVTMHVTTHSDGKVGELKPGAKNYLAGKAVEQKKRECAEKLDGFRVKSKNQGKCLVPVSRHVQVRINGMVAGDARSMLNTVLCSDTAKFSDPSMLTAGGKNMLLFQMKDGAMVEAELSTCHVSLVFVSTRKGSGKKKMSVGEERKGEVEDGEEEKKQVGVVQDMTGAHWIDTGCYEDGKNGFRLINGHKWTDGGMTRGSCQTFAALNYMEYAGVENGNECFIGSLAYNTGQTGGCDTWCGGKWTETCGGVWRIQVFRDGNYFYTVTGSWRAYPGIQLKSVALVNSGALYGVKTDGGIVTKNVWSTGSWSTIPGALANIAAEESMVVGVNSQGHGYVRNGVNSNTPTGSSWTHVGSGFLMMAVSTRYVYALKTDNILLRQSRSTVSSSGWTTYHGAGQLKQISAHGKWVTGVNLHGKIFMLDEDTSAWSYKSCQISALWAMRTWEGELMVITTGHDVLRWQSNLGWKRYIGSLIQIDATHSYRVGVNAQNVAYQLLQL